MTHCEHWSVAEDCCSDEVSLSLVQEVEGGGGGGDGQVASCWP